MNFKSDQSEIQDYLNDAANFKGKCERVYLPESVDDIVKIVKSANSNRKKITVCGARTGLTGGAVPQEGLVLSTEKLNKIIKISSEEKFAVVQPGVFLSELNEKLSELNLYYPPDPTEQNCFIGGTIATNASGAKTFKYGPTRNFVQELSIILPDGEMLNLKRGEVNAKNYILSLKTESNNVIEIGLPKITMPKTKHSAGYYITENMDAIDLFIGMEGTLGIITEIKLALIKKPAKIISMVIFFKTESEALQFVKIVRDLSKKYPGATDKINARGIEFFDKNSFKFVKGSPGLIPKNTGAAIWIEQETTTKSQDAILEEWITLMETNNINVDESWIALSEKERKEFEYFRHSVPSQVNEYISRNNFRKVGTDTAVPDNKLEEYYNYCKQTAENSGIDYVIYGHIGNSHIHLNFILKSQQEYEPAKQLYKQMCIKAVELGGTVSAEHGIGKMKREYLVDMFGEEIVKEMAAIKKTLDPKLILNIGNIFDPGIFN
ncbi:MAG: FAD-binding oxidoreductase [Melioribacteraceae bacterium]|nr:FAD-binding oxidoreductase [Melioribacteraceae bacterium]MDD3557242.1 FAD-binding oxidoreductase [Melioribacteraceae bacterium]